MNCPKCGKEQDGKTSFCRHCGHRIKPLTAKQRTARAVQQGLGLMLFGLVLVSVLTILKDLNFIPQVYVKIAGVIFCLGGVIRMCWPWIAGYADQPLDGVGELNFDVATNAFPDLTTKQLPPEQSIPIMNFPAPSYKTSDLTDPPSVTENTTKLLDR